MSNYVIALSYGCGAAGEQVAQRLAERLDIPCYEVLPAAMQNAAENTPARQQTFLSRRMQTIRAFRPAGAEKQPQEQPPAPDEALFAAQVRELRRLAERTSCVVVGKCTEYILRGRENVLCVRIEAPQAARARCLCDGYGIGQADAQARVCRSDQYDAGYYRYCTQGGASAAPSQFDLTVNAERLGLTDMVNVILASAMAKLDGCAGAAAPEPPPRVPDWLRRKPDNLSFAHCKWFY